MLLEILAYNFLFFFFFAVEVMSLSVLGISVKLASLTEFLNVPSFFILCTDFRNIDISSSLKV